MEGTMIVYIYRWNTISVTTRLKVCGNCVDLSQDKHEEADQLYSKVVATEEKTLGSDHFSVAKSRDSWASLKIKLVRA